VKLLHNLKTVDVHERGLSQSKLFLGSLLVVQDGEDLTHSASCDCQSGGMVYSRVPT